ncbi:MAG: CinA family nicotinamide mononucleotide deamidase-related protein [Anaerolineales bacterium]
MRAEILTIGTELLLGEIVDTNTADLARAFRSIGADLFRTMTVGDNVERIAEAVRESLARSDVVLTTGGLGPTVDDPTREGIALALGVPLEFKPELWVQIQERFARFRRRPTENNRRQAHIPQGATAFENKVGTAPGFWAEAGGHVVIALPGVPAEMRHLLEGEVLPFLQSRFALQEVIEVRVLRTAGAGESWLDQRIADLERLSNPTVGVSAHPGRVDIRITAKGKGRGEAQELILPLEIELRRRLGEAVYGADGATLELAVAGELERHGWGLVILEGGTDGALAAALPVGVAVNLDMIVAPGDLPTQVRRQMSETGAHVGLGLGLDRQGEDRSIEIAVVTPDTEKRVQRGYGGPPGSATEWAVSLALDTLRRVLHG